MDFAAAIAPALGASSSWADVVVFGLILMAIILVGGIAILILRQRVLKKSDENLTPAQTLEQFEQLRDRGLLSDEEFSRARRKVMGLPPAPKVEDEPPAESS